MPYRVKGISEKGADHLQSLETDLRLFHQRDINIAR